MADTSPQAADWPLTLLDDPGPSRRWLAGLGVSDAERGCRDLADLLGRTRAERPPARQVT